MAPGKSTKIQITNLKQTSMTEGKNVQNRQNRFEHFTLGAYDLFEFWCL
jgi:hypothetical protein